MEPKPPKCRSHSSSVVPLSQYRKELSVWKLSDPPASVLSSSVLLPLDGSTRHRLSLLWPGRRANTNPCASTSSADPANFCVIKVVGSPALASTESLTRPFFKLLIQYR